VVHPFAGRDESGNSFENIDEDFFTHLNEKSILEFLITSSRFCDFYCLDRTRLSILKEKNCTDSKRLQSGFSYWVDAILEVPAVLSHILWVFFDDFFGIFKSYLLQAGGNPDGQRLNELYDKYFQGKFQARFKEVGDFFESKALVSNVSCYRCMFDSISCLFQDALTTMYSWSSVRTDSDPLSDSASLHSKQCKDIQFISFGGWAIASMIKVEKALLNRNLETTSPVISCCTIDISAYHTKINFFKTKIGATSFE